MSNIKADIVINGNIVDNINSGDRIIRKKSIEYLESTQTWNMQHFYKGHIDEIRLIMKDLSTFEKALMFSIATYIGYSDCCLKYDNGNELSFDDIQDISGICRGQLSQTIASLIKKDILYKGKNSKSRQYFVNPWIFCKGQRVNTILKTMFRNYRIRVINKKWKDIK